MRRAATPGPKGNRVRIVGGALRSRIVRFEDRPGLRPTPDRVRETLFNWLGQDLTGCAVLDLYAGSGALGFEAASRGARRVVMVERDAHCVQNLLANRDELQARQVEVVKGDALEFVRRSHEQYDVIFLDPPFADAPWPRLLETLQPLVAPEGLVYCESGAPVPAPPGWAEHKQGHAGQVHYGLLKRTAHEPHSGISGNV